MQVEKLIHMAAVVVAFATCVGSMAETVRGRVFNDTNGNGSWDAGEPGVSNVGVSDGATVVTTDNGGEYALEIDGDATIFVIKPSHWQVALDPDTKLPRHYYVHRPEGSPESKFPGVAPTGPLPASVDFPLTPRDEHGPFSVLCFGDTQPRNQDEVDYISHDIIEELIGTDVAFGFTLGDLVFDNLDMLPQIAQGVGTLQIPWYHVIGNHDLNFDTPDYAREAETYTRVFGPPYHSFNYGKVHFLALNDIYWETDNRRYHGEFGARQLEFIKNDLALVPKDHLVVALMHIPLQDVVDREKLFALLKPFPNNFSIAAHWHRQSHFYMGTDAGWSGEGEHHHLVQGTACGSWWTGGFDELGIPHTTMSDGVPNGYAYVTFSGTDYSVRYKASRRPADYQMNIAAPESIAPEEATSTAVVANIFSGSAKSTARMRVSGGAWVAMEQFSGFDPFYVQAKDREAALATLLAKAEGNLEPSADDLKRAINQHAHVVGRSLPDARETDHLWRAMLPADLEPGYHTIEVETTDQFGQTFTGRRIIRVVSGM